MNWKTYLPGIAMTSGGVALVVFSLLVGQAQERTEAHEFSPAVYQAINASGLNAAEAMQRTLPHLSVTARAELAAAVDILYVSPEKARVTAVRLEAASKEAELRDAPIVRERRGPEPIRDVKVEGPR